ncbi:GrpB family protein [Deinococcus arboris]|nr:GrpB family protein [Deinococcus arboris]
MTLGLRRGLVQLRPSSPEYPTLFAAERERVAQALGPLALEIEHVGSTSVPGLVAKPVLDLAVAVSGAGQMPQCRGPLTRLGSTFRGDPAGQGEAFYALGPDDARTHYLHLLPITHPHWRAYLVFRGALRADPELRGAYADLRLALARAHPEARTEYTARKGAFIEGVLRQAETTAAP